MYGLGVIYVKGRYVTRWKDVLTITCLISFFSFLAAQGESKAVGEKELAVILASFEQYAEKSMLDWETPGMP